MNKMIRVLAILMIVLCVGGSGISGCGKKKDIEPVSYVSDLMGIELSGYIEDSEYDYCSDKNEESAHIKLLVKADQEEELIRLLSEKYGQGDYEAFKDYGYQGHQYKSQIDAGEVVNVISIFKEGKKAKTRNIEVYVVYRDNRLYLYSMG